MQCRKNRLNNRLDWTKIGDAIQGNWEVASNNTHEIYGSVTDIIRNNREPRTSQELRERNIFFEKTLELLNNITLKRLETYTIKTEEEKTAQDHLKDMIEMDNVVCFD